MVKVNLHLQTILWSPLFFFIFNSGSSSSSVETVSECLPEQTQRPYDQWTYRTEHFWKGRRVLVHAHSKEITFSSIVPEQDGRF